MKVIEIGICVNNIDPKGIGRIRYRPYNQYVSEIANGIEYEEWDDRDPFIALPFLPLHVNIVPQVQQSIKIIKYDTEKAVQNVEYIPGPFSSPHDLQNQTFTSQHRDTTYGGVIIKGIKDIRSKNGKFNSPTSPGAVIRDSDTGFRGNYGSDIIFTENGLQLRGGMLISKQSNNKTLLDYPQLSKKMGRLNLKKFPKTGKAVKEIVEASEIAVSKLYHIIEYEIDNLEQPVELRLYVYRVVGGNGVEFDTNVFGENTVINSEFVKLINTGNTQTDATYIIPLDRSITDAYVQLRDILTELDDKDLTILNKNYPKGDIHPFYYRPTPTFRLTKGTTEADRLNKTTFYNKIQVRNKIGSSGLIYSKQNANPPATITQREKYTYKEVNEGEQSFGHLGADKIFLLSTSPNVGANVKSINFKELDEYELTQEDYISKIDPNTYGIPRGEILYEILVAIVNLLNSHKHNINKPLAQSDPNWAKLDKLMQTLRNDLMNDSIRIN